MKKFFGKYGGQYVPEPVIKALDELEKAYLKFSKSKKFINELDELLKDYVGRPSPLYHAKRLSEHFGHNIYLKREDLNHTGAHKINNSLGQALLAKYMGKKKIIAETGAGQHGVATATAAALLGLECDVYMGELDIERQALNVHKMKLLGANVVAVKSGRATLSDAVDAAIDAWIKDIKDTFYVLGSAVGPYPYPHIVRDFQAIIGKECKAQLKERGIKPEYIIACVGGGSNAIGIFSSFIKKEKIKLIGVEAGGLGIHTRYHAATMSKGAEGVLHGMKTIVLQDDNGDILPVYSISAGLDYPGVGPEHAHLKDIGRVRYEAVSDDECIEALNLLSRLEGIIPAIESSHALAFLPKLASELKKRSNIVVNISGRGDKDMMTIMSYEKGKIYG